MREELINIKNEAMAQIMEVKSSQELETLRINYLGRNGKINEILKNIKDVKPEDRVEIGKLVNEVKNTISLLLAEQDNKFTESVRDWFDTSVPGIKPKIGKIHLVTKAIREISKLFEDIGFVRSRYPEVEWDYFAFSALNMPKEHAARDEWETFFVDVKENPKYGKMVLTPHTSSGQIREMFRVKNPPIRMINIAKTYRRQLDVSHNQMFHQFEGLVVDEGINITHLKGTLDYFAKNFFGEKRTTRLRPYHFQFTEPSFEVDISCGLCDGKGCKFCKSGWLELGGAGMVHPNVLKECGIDPNKYSGFAFGWGVERTFMMKSGLKIDDIRKLYGADIRFLKQF